MKKIEYGKAKKMQGGGIGTISEPGRKAAAWRLAQGNKVMQLGGYGYGGGERW